MASLTRHRSGNYLVAFRWGGKQMTRSLGTTDREIADAAVARVNETLMRLRRGWLVVPEGCTDVGTFIVSGGALSITASQPVADAVPLSVAALFERYEADLPKTAKEASTRGTEKIHRKHLERLIGEQTPVAEISLSAAQRYVAARSKETWNDKPIKGDTIIKELKTLRYVWGWARKFGLIAADCPWQLQDLQFGKQEIREPFRTMAEIEKRLARGGLTKDEQERLWECLYLTSDEVKALLAYVREHARAHFVYPMVAFCAMTGARRSELCRSRIDDFDFANQTVHIRERKRDQSRTETLRNVDIHPMLRTIMEDWFGRHPGGQYTLAQNDGARVSVHLASSYLYRTLESHEKWSKIPGFHTLRHSFASILASNGVDQRIIDAFMGHQTEEMRARYQHLFPKAKRSAIDALFD